MNDTAPITIRRGAAGEPSRTVTYTVPWREGMSVLDAVLWLRAHVDSSLAVRYSCTNANACKECVVSVDGKSAYACTARLPRIGVTVAPLPNKPLLRDLVTDLVPAQGTHRHPPLKPANTPRRHAHVFTLPRLRRGRSKANNV